MRLSLESFSRAPAVIAIVIFSMGIALGAVGMAATGLVPDTEEVLRILIFLILYSDLRCILAGTFDSVFRCVPTCGDLRTGVDLCMDFLLDLHEPGGKYYCKRCVPGGR